MIMTTPNDNPPSYEHATSPTGPAPAPAGPNGDTKGAPSSPAPQKVDMPQPLLGPQMPGPSSYPTITLYHYQHPLSGDAFSSPLPPDHPEMICLQEGRHITETNFSLLGILAAIFWFPLGVGLCLLDRRVRCRRCGLIIDDGLCG